MKRELIKTIRVDKSNFEHIAKTGNINGTLLVEIERIMDEYAKNQANGQSTGERQLTIPDVSDTVCRGDNYHKGFCKKWGGDCTKGHCDYWQTGR